MTTRKTHDADLCERIRELEKRVEELERRPTPYWTYPWWGVNPPYWTTPYYPYVTTTGGISTGSTTVTDGSISVGNVTTGMVEQWSYTGENVS